MDKADECQILKAVQRGIRLKAILLLAEGGLPDQCHSLSFFDPRHNLGQWFCLATPEPEIKMGSKTKQARIDITNVILKKCNKFYR